MTNTTETREQRADRYELLAKSFIRDTKFQSPDDEHLLNRSRRRIAIFETVITEAIMDARGINISWEDIATVLGLTTEEAINQFESQVNRHRELLREEDNFGLPRATCPQSFD